VVDAQVTGALAVGGDDACDASAVQATTLRAVGVSQAFCWRRVGLQVVRGVRDIGIGRGIDGGIEFGFFRGIACGIDTRIAIGIRIRVGRRLRDIRC
jgi:hypothetical protein